MCACVRARVCVRACVLGGGGRRRRRRVLTLFSSPSEASWYRGVLCGLCAGENILSISIDTMRFRSLTTVGCSENSWGTPAAGLEGLGSHLYISGPNHPLGRFAAGKWRVIGLLTIILNGFRTFRICLLNTHPARKPKVSSELLGTRRRNLPVAIFSEDKVAHSNGKWRLRLGRKTSAGIDIGRSR